MDHVVLLDARGRSTGTAAKSDVHSAETPLHLAFSCHVVGRDGRVLITRRSEGKRTWPGVWTNACCGHPQLGESLREAVTRRLAQELGVVPEQMALVLPDFAYRAQMADGTVEHELCPVVVALVDGDPVPDPTEISDTAWVSWTGLLERASAAPHTLSPWSVEQLELLRPGGPLQARLTGIGDAALDAPLPLRGAQPAQVRVPGGATAAVAAPLQRLLSSFLDEVGGAATDLDPALGEVVREVRALLDAGGKRLRPAFVYWGHRAAGAAHDDEVLLPAGAVELLHTFALLHDDVMDRSAVRRGRPAAHVGLSSVPAAGGTPEAASWFGASAAILAGDLTFVWADRLFDRARFSTWAKDRAREEFTVLREEVIAGQYLDLRLPAQRGAQEQSAMRVALLKSARYTVTRPLLLGAALAGEAADSSVRAALQTYGDAVGTAFQMRDDVLGLFGDSELTGKGALDDLREGKRTVLVLRALRLADAAGRRLVERHLGDPDLDEGDAERVREVVAGSGALASVEALIANLHGSAVQALAAVGSPAREALEELAALSVERRS